MPHHQLCPGSVTSRERYGTYVRSKKCDDGGNPNCGGLSCGSAGGDTRWLNGCLGGLGNGHSSSAFFLDLRSKSKVTIDEVCSPFWVKMARL